MIKIENFSFQGINGAYSELAGINIFPEADSLACATFEEMFQTVREGKANVAIVPIENSQAGQSCRYSTFDSRFRLENC